MNLQDIVSEASTLFVLPDSVTRLKACLDDDASSIDDISEIITYDPALATQLLRVANSALYRFPNRIDTIEKALKVIGTRSTYELALAFGVSNAFNEVDGQVIDLDKFWEQSVSCGLLAKYFADMWKLKEPERFFVAGLLHHIGELVVVSMLPEQATRCQNFNARVSPSELQKGVLGFTYTALSVELIKKWDIPSTIYGPIAAIDGAITAENKATSNAIDEQILALSYILAIDNVNSGIYPSYNNLQPHLYESLSLSREDLEDALDIINLQCISVISLFNPNAFMLY